MRNVSENSDDSVAEIAEYRQKKIESEIKKLEESLENSSDLLRNTAKEVIEIYRRLEILKKLG